MLSSFEMSALIVLGIQVAARSGSSIQLPVLPRPAVLTFRNGYNDSEAQWGDDGRINAPCRISRASDCNAAHGPPGS